jgi:hypothetical protein
MNLFQFEELTDRIGRRAAAPMARSISIVYREAFRCYNRRMAFVVVLEDDPSRVAAMRRVLSELLPAAEMLAFDNAPDAVAFLNVYLLVQNGRIPK